MRLRVRAAERVDGALQRDALRLEQSLDPAGRVAPTHARADLLVVAERILGEHRIRCAEPAGHQPVGDERETPCGTGEASVRRVERLVTQQLEVEHPGAHGRGQPCGRAARPAARHRPQQAVPCIGEQGRVGREEQHAPDARVVHDPRAAPQQPGALWCDEPVGEPRMQQREGRAQPARVRARAAERAGEVDGVDAGRDPGVLEDGELRERGLVEPVVATERVQPCAGPFGPAVLARAQPAVEPQRRLGGERVLRRASCAERVSIGRSDRRAQQRESPLELVDEQRQVEGAHAGHRCSRVAHATPRPARRRSRRPRRPAVASPRCRP